MPVPPATSVRARIRGIDMARALAIVGMVMVHVGPNNLPGGGLSGAAYRATHGRAAVVFVVLAGIGVSLLAGDGSRDRRRRTWVLLGWRTLVLLPVGLALQSLQIDVAVILQYYAVYFLVTMVALGRSDRALLTAAACSLLLGPVALIWLERTVPGWFQPGVPAWYDVVRLIRDIMLTGYYPVIVWTAPLLLGMWMGRRDLRSSAIVRSLGLGGAITAAGAFVVSDLLVALFGPATSASDWHRLYVIVPHNEMPLWVLTSTGIAVAVICGCVLLAHRLPRGTWPLVALGQLAFTAYVLHLLVLDIWPQWLTRSAYDAAWLSVARFTLVALLLATAYRAVSARGPFELLLRPSLLTPSPRTTDPTDDRG